MVQSQQADNKRKEVRGYDPRLWSLTGGTSSALSTKFDVGL